MLGYLPARQYLAGKCAGWLIFLFVAMIPELMHLVFESKAKTDGFDCVFSLIWVFCALFCPTAFHSSVLSGYCHFKH